jgi:hypothetical protein
MNNVLRLTLITIVKDDADGLRRTLASAEAWRASPEVEHLVVYLGAFGGQEGEDPRVTWCPQRSIGIAAAFNEGLARARGEWVWFLNGGDRIHEALGVNWLLTWLATTRSQMVTGALHYDGEAEPLGPPPPAEQWPMARSWPAHPATLVRRETLLAVGGFDERWRICMDFDLWYRLFARAIRVDVVSIPFARFATGGVSTRPGNRCLVLRENRAIMTRHAGKVLGALSVAALRCLRTWARGVR